MMLDHLGGTAAAQAVEQAVIAQIEDGDVTPDLGGNLNCSEVGDRLLARLVP